MPISLREKKLFFLFSKLNSVNNRNVRFTLVVDYFLNNQNKSTNLIEVHSELDKKIGLNSSPESLKRDISNSDLMHYFHGFSKKQKIEKEFNLNQKLYKTLISYEENTDVLEELITEFLFKKQEDPIKYKVILEIFYEALIERNLMFLRQASSMKEIGGLTKQLQIDLKKVHSKHENADLLLYNEFILNSDKKFNDILRVLVNKVFEFMQLHYDPTLDKHNNKAFKNKIFYLDSSFIMRLFGFNDLIRRDRALELIKILKTIPNVKFVVHQETINETNNAITNIVNNAEKYINNQRALIDKIGRYSKCKLHALELFDDLKASKKISSYKEFKLYYGNVSKVLKRIFGNDFELNDEKFETPDPDVKYKDLEDEIFKFEWKSANRSRHIAGLITYLAGLRGSNNVNLYDIHHWLITTDQTTLKIDLDLCFADGFKSKPVCILPTELLTALSEHKDLDGEYVEVFKKFMLYSNVFEKEYSDDDLLIINGVIDLVEEYKTTDYNPDIMIDALIEEDFLSEVKKRFIKAENKTSKRKKIAEFFVEHYNRTYKGKYNKFISARFSINYRNIKLLFRLPAIVLTGWFCFLLLNWSGFELADPKTWIKIEEWGELEAVFTIIVSSVWYITRVIFKKRIPLKISTWYMIKKYNLDKKEAESFVSLNFKIDK